jgi:tetratricopeptide (TPR) repeat protein
MLSIASFSFRSTKFSWSRIVLLFLLIVTTSVSVGQAEEADPVKTAAGKALMEEAIGLFTNKDYTAALKKFQTILGLISDDNRPGQAAIYFDIGRCLEELSRTNEAIETYKKYLELADEGEEKEEVKRRINGLQSSATPSAGAQPSTAPFPLIVPPPSVPPAPTPAPRKTTYYMSGIFGVVAVVGAIVAGISFAVADGQKKGLDACMPRCAPSLVDQYSLTNTVAITGAVVGGISLPLSIAGFLIRR